jgi:hypothetical protein
MDELASAHGVQLPDDLRAWWAWHNGSLQDGVPFFRTLLIPGGQMLPLAKALRDRDKKRAWARSDLTFTPEERKRLWPD